MGLQCNDYANLTLVSLSCIELDFILLIRLMLCRGFDNTLRVFPSLTVNIFLNLHLWWKAGSLPNEIILRWQVTGCKTPRHVRGGSRNHVHIIRPWHYTNSFYKDWDCGIVLRNRGHYLEDQKYKYRIHWNKVWRLLFRHCSHKSFVSRSFNILLTLHLAFAFKLLRNLSSTYYWRLIKWKFTLVIQGPKWRKGV